MSRIGGSLSAPQPFQPEFLTRLSGVNQSEPASELGLKALKPADGTTSFETLMWQALQGVNDADRNAQTQIAAGLTDGDLAKAEIFTSVKKAEIALRTMLQVRNKLLDAYNELKNLRM